MTEPGQSLNLPRSWIINYHANKWTIMSLNIVLLGGLWYLNSKFQFWKNMWMYLASLGVIFCIIAANFLLTAFFPSYQYDANYVSIQEANDILSDDDIIYAVENNGETKGFPRKHLEIPHIAGASIGGEDVMMTFCALSNLAVVYEQDIGYGESDIGILIQVHNNLLMVDRESGELIQQITGKTEFSGKELKSYPNEMMSWRVFKQLYPDAEVFIYDFNRLLDTLLLALFEGPMEKQFSEEFGPIFPTLSMQDNRLPYKEQVWGLNIEGEQVAFTKNFMENNPTYEFEQGGKQLVIYYDKEFDIVTLFEQTIDTSPAGIADLDFKGNTPHGKLKKIPLHNGVFWMIWSHWFPDTKLYS
jgi:hypothetical protein